MILIIDNGSSYISQLCNAVSEYELKRWSDTISMDGCDGVILSGRNKNDNEINVKNIGIVRYCYNNNIPLLGICYGAEILALALGGTIMKTDKVHGYYDIRINEKILVDKDVIRVFESHGYIISKIPQGFRSIAYSQNSKNEIIIKDNMIGVQFHPELTDDGLALIERFLMLVRKEYYSLARK